jgi:hypothetical protein
MASEIPYNFEYFERQDASPIENLIREYRHDICQAKVGPEYIEKTLNQYDFGFARHNKKQVTSFVLCRLLPSPLFKNVDVVLVCSRTDGKHLLELVESHAKILNYQSLSLIAIGNRRLLNWYTSQGYIWETEKPILNSDSNAYYVKKYI